MTTSARLSLVFSCIGHSFIHMFIAFYFVIVLAMEGEWGLSYADLIELWTLGSLLVGAAALPAGWLRDKWSTSGMMVLFFVGMGACSIIAGLADGPGAMVIWLAGIGVFAAIYHPVGVPWLIHNAGDHKGKILGINGVFGSLGSALAGLVAGTLIDLADWRAAFIVPGIVCLATGLTLLFLLARGRITDGAATAGRRAEGPHRDAGRAVVILLLCMAFGGLIYHTTQTALPKVLELRHDGLVGEGAFGIGVLVATVYTAGGIMQMAGGWLADRFPLKLVYFVGYLIQAPLLWWVASATGVSLVMVAALMVMAGLGVLPAENVLLARYTPERRHGLAFGVKFVISFGMAPLAVQFVSFVHGATHEFYWAFTTIAGLAALALAAIVFLPNKPVPLAVAAE